MFWGYIQSSDLTAANLPSQSSADIVKQEKIHLDQWDKEEKPVALLNQQEGGVRQTKKKTDSKVCSLVEWKTQDFPSSQG